MDLTGGTKATAIAGAAVLLSGLSVILYGIVRGDVSQAVSGACLTMPALTLIALVMVRRWVTDTKDERAILAASQREAQAERARYLAAQGALDGEMSRLRQDMAAERAALKEQLKVERKAMEDEFARARGELAAEAMNIAVSWVVDGKLRPPEQQRDNLIRFPHQTQQPESRAEPARSREHGVVGP
jgi:hypothetical protein